MRVTKHSNRRICAFPAGEAVPRPCTRADHHCRGRAYPARPRAIGSVAVFSALFSMVLLAASARAQVLSPDEIRDPKMRELQKKYFAELKQITNAAATHHFPYRFYFSRTLDLSEKEQQRSDQRSVQFDQYRDQVVLKITGNYFAAYSAELMKPEERARQTYEDVMLPLLQAAVVPVEKVDGFQAFAFEISHHVRTNVLGVASERAENVVLILPKASAQRLVAATDPQAQRAAVLEGEAYLNAAPISLWPRPEGEVAKGEVAKGEAAKEPPRPEASAPARSPGPPKLPSVTTSVAAMSLDNPVKQSSLVVAPVRDSSPEALKKLQNSYQAGLDRMVQELDAQAHFVRYAPPAFIPFHNGLYLQLSVTATLPESSAGSQYKLAALAFDQHIAHLIRPILSYLKDEHGDFDGVDFSASVRLGTGQASDGSSVAVEFILSQNMLRAYEQFDCTGQQLIDSGFVLINGERVSLNLQIAEAGVQLR